MVAEEKKFTNFASCPDKVNNAYDSTDLEQKKPLSEHGRRADVVEDAKESYASKIH